MAQKRPGGSCMGSVQNKKYLLSTRYRRLAARRGKKRAALAVGHTILVMAYHIIKERRTYNELGADYFNKLNEQHLVSRLTSRISALGYEVKVEKQSVAA